MAHYNFITYWELSAPLEAVWDLIVDASAWPTWWKGVLEVKEMDSGRDEKHSKHFSHTWRSFIPYKLKFETEIVAMQYHQSIKAQVTGELEGTGKWDFKRDGNGNTTVTYYWLVSTTTKWMN